jgi:hypothetical protein
MYAMAVMGRWSYCTSGEARLVSAVVSWAFEWPHGAPLARTMAETVL